MSDGDWVISDREFLTEQLGRLEVTSQEVDAAYAAFQPIEEEHNRWMRHAMIGCALSILSGTGMLAENKVGGIEVKPEYAVFLSLVYTTVGYVGWSLTGMKRSFFMRFFRDKFVDGKADRLKLLLTYPRGFPATAFSVPAMLPPGWEIDALQRNKTVFFACCAILLAFAAAIGWLVMLTALWTRMDGSLPSWLTRATIVFHLVAVLWAHQLSRNEGAKWTYKPTDRAST